MSLTKVLISFSEYSFLLIRRRHDFVHLLIGSKTPAIFSTNLVTRVFPRLRQFHFTLISLWLLDEMLTASRVASLGPSSFFLPEFLIGS